MSLHFHDILVLPDGRCLRRRDIFRRYIDRPRPHWRMILDQLLDEIILRLPSFVPLEQADQAFDGIYDLHWISSCFCAKGGRDTYIPFLLNFMQFSDNKVGASFP